MLGCVLASQASVRVDFRVSFFVSDSMAIIRLLLISWSAFFDTRCLVILGSI